MATMCELGRKENQNMFKNYLELEDSLNLGKLEYCYFLKGGGVLLTLNIPNATKRLDEIKNDGNKVNKVEYYKNQILL